MIENGLAQVNHIFLAKMECHYPVAGTYSKAITMFDI